MDIVIVGQQPWDVEIGSNCKNLALEFSKTNRVLYVNSALDRITLLKEKNLPRVQKRLDVIKHKQPGLVGIGNNLWNLYPDCLVESITWLKSRPLFNFLNRINNRRFANSILKAVAELGFKDFILFNDNDMFRSFYLKEYLKPAISIYYSRDYMLGVDYWKFHGTKLEPALIAKSDICMSNSTYLTDYCKRHNPHSYNVGQGCDLEMFSNLRDTTTPADMVHIPHPVIGYVGALLSLRLDIELLVHLAAQKPDWSIVLVGPEDDAFKGSQLHSIKNVYFLGGKPTDELPTYINAFDVCINPQLINEVTIGNYPRKIDEYLATGKPVVATKTEAMSIFADYTYLAAGKNEYPVLIEKALAEDNTDLQHRRREFAESHTWENNVKEIYRVITDFMLNSQKK